MFERIKLVVIRLCWHLAVRHLIKLVMYYFPKIDEASLVEFDLIVTIEFDTCRVEEANVSHEILAIDTANHELSLP